MKQKQKKKHKHRGYGQQIHDLKSPVQSEAIDESLALFLMVIKDKMGVGMEELREIWENVQTMAAAVGDESVDLLDCIAELQRDAGVYIDPVSIIMLPQPKGLCYADVITARQRTKRRAINMTEAMILWVLMRKHGWVPATLKGLKAGMDYQADSLAKAYIKVEDMIAVLKEEYGIEIVGTPAV